MMRRAVGVAAFRKSIPLVASVMVPQSTTATAVLLAHSSGVAGIASLVSVMATLVSFAMVAGVGIMVCTVRDVAIARSRGSDEGAALAANLGYAGVFALASLPVLVVVTGVFVGVGVAPAEDIWWLALTQVPVLLATPFSAVFNGAFQSIDRGGENLLAALVQGVIVVGGAVLAFVGPLRADPLLALVVYGAVYAAGSIVVVVWRAERLRRLMVVSRHPSLRVTGAGVQDRVLAALDAVVFVGVFLVVQSVASAVSPHTGDAVAIAIAFARTIIVPLKQVGVTVARVEMSMGQGQQQAATRLAWVTVASTPYVLLGAAATVAYGLATSSDGDWRTLVVLLTAQLLIEPYAGVLYSYVKVRLGPRAGIPGLLIAYLGFVPVALVALAVSQATASQFWVALLVARIGFAVGNLRVLVRHGSSET